MFDNFLAPSGELLNRPADREKDLAPTFDSQNQSICLPLERTIKWKVTTWNATL